MRAVEAGKASIGRVRSPHDPGSTHVVHGKASQSKENRGVSEEDKSEGVAIPESDGNATAAIIDTAWSGAQRCRDSRVA